MPAGWRSNATILLVEDDRDSLDALSEILSLEGYSIAAMRSGEEALNYLRTSPPVRLVILDLTMPGIDGAQFLARAREDPTLSRAPVIVVSGVETTLPVQASFRKPLDIEQLLRTVRMLLVRQVISYPV